MTKIANNKILILMRGVPGSGKSTLAESLAPKDHIFSTDDYWMQNNEYKFDISKLGIAHQWNKDRTAKAMQTGISPIVVDNTNRKFWEMLPYVKLAQNFGYDVQFEEPNWSPELKTEEGKWSTDFLEGKNSHGVDRTILERMVKDYQYNPTVEKILGTEK